MLRYQERDSAIHSLGSERELLLPCRKRRRRKSRPRASVRTQRLIIHSCQPTDLAHCQTRNFFFHPCISSSSLPFYHPPFILQTTAVSTAPQVLLSSAVYLYLKLTYIVPSLSAWHPAGLVNIPPNAQYVLSAPARSNACIFLVLATNYPADQQVATLSS